MSLHESTMRLLNGGVAGSDDKSNDSDPRSNSGPGPGQGQVLKVSRVSMSHFEPTRNRNREVKREYDPEKRVFNSLITDSSVCPLES